MGAGAQLSQVRRHLAAGRVELSIRYDDWKHLDATAALGAPSDVDADVFEQVGRLLASLYTRRVALRHVGITLSRFSSRQSGGELFDPPQKHQRPQLYHALDEIRDRFGHAAVVTGESIGLLGHLEQNDYGFVLRTPSLTK